MLDAYDHQYIPEHMLTREFLSEVRSLLTPERYRGGQYLFLQPPVSERVRHLRSVFGSSTISRAATA